MLIRRTSGLAKIGKILTITLFFYIINSLFSIIIFFPIIPFFENVPLIAKIIYSALCLLSLAIFTVTRKAYEDLAYDSFLKLSIFSTILGIFTAFIIGGILVYYSRKMMIENISRR